MGQLEVFGLDDNMVAAVIGGSMYSYFAEEIDATIESIATYIFSFNLSAKALYSKLNSKKRKHWKYTSIMLGNSDEEQFKIFTNLKLKPSNARIIDKTLEERIFWQELSTRVVDSDKELKENETNYKK